LDALDEGAARIYGCRVSVNSKSLA